MDIELTVSIQMTKVSVILPTKNVEDNIGDLLSSIYHQDFSGEIETIILDSSNDKTPEIAKDFPVEFIRVEEDNYNYGGTRNYGARMASGKYLIFLSADVVIKDSQWLTKLLTPFKDSIYKQKRDDHYTQAFAAVREAVSKSIVAPTMKMPYNSKSIGDIPTAVTVHLPVRVDLAGGWTDTPPISLEKGGAVLNVALLLNGHYPISVTARRIPESVIRLKSVDQKKEAEFHDVGSFKTLFT